MIFVKTPDPIVFGPARPVKEYRVTSQAFGTYWNEYLDFLHMREEMALHQGVRSEEFFEVPNL